MKPIHIFQFVTNPVCARYRLHIPAKYLSFSERFKVTSFNQFTAEIYHALIEQADILIVQRLPYSPQLEKIVKALNALGKIVIYEIDDDLFNLPTESEYLKNAPPDYTAKLKKAVQLCQAVQCSTDGLASVLSEFHNEAYVLENQLDEVPQLVRKVKADIAPIIIAYAAGENHWCDWLVIKDEVNQLAKNTHDKVEFLIMGDEKIYESLQAENKKFLPPLSYEDYMRALKLVDISLIPLQDNKFNRSKSDIKFLESAAAGCAVLASKQVYSKTLRHDSTGLLFADQAEFLVQFKNLVENPALIYRLGRSAHEYVNSKRKMSHHIESWCRIYEELFVRRRDLLKIDRT